jgi:hypothetical protein
MFFFVRLRLGAACFDRAQGRAHRSPDIVNVLFH